MKKPYCCEASRHLFNQYYAKQQKGGGDFPVYVGRMRQRGHGIGDIFRSLWRFISPAIKSLAICLQTCTHRCETVPGSHK
jgi:hypothetical protein